MGRSMLDVVIEEGAVRIGARFAVAFQRTLRVPDDGRTYPLPPGLGALPVLDVRAYADRVPAEWGDERAAFIPMYQREALWLSFAAAPWKPNAVQIAVGGVNAVSGEPDATGLRADPQNYVVCPEQLWLDGINTGRGVVRQFVAMPLGLGYTVEASVTGRETVGGIQITVFEPKPGRFPDAEPPPPESAPGRPATRRPAASAQPMGLGAGGAMRQKIYPDPYGVDAWDTRECGRVVVHIVNSAQYLEITGRQPPPTPVDAKTYTDHGLPWFDLYDETKGDVAAPAPLTGVKTVAERDRERGIVAADAPVDVPESLVMKLPHDARGPAPGGSKPTPPRADPRSD